MEGLFTTPSQLRDARLADLMKQRQAINTGMGGSMSGLLGQVAAGGALTGQMLAEGMGGMFGLKTAEEDKASQIQDLLSQFDINTPEGAATAARLLNNQGFTNEALAVMKHRQGLLAGKADELSIQKAERDLANEETRVVMLPVKKKAYNPATGQIETSMVTQQFTQVKDKNGNWVFPDGYPEEAAVAEPESSSDSTIILREGTEPPKQTAAEAGLPAEPRSQFTPEQKTQMTQQAAEFMKTLTPADREGLKTFYVKYRNQTDQPVDFVEWLMVVWPKQQAELTR